MKPHTYTSVFHDWFTFSNYYSIIARRLAELRRPVRIAEIGVLEGAGTSYLCVELMNLGVEFTLFAHDTFALGKYEHFTFENQLEKFSKQMRQAGCYERVIPIKGDSSLKASIHDDNSLDFVFVDGNHSFMGLVKDVGAYWNKLKDGGIMGAHDYTPAHPAVWAFGNELARNPELNVEFYGEPDNVWSVTKNPITTP